MADQQFSALSSSDMPVSKLSRKRKCALPLLHESSDDFVEGGTGPTKRSASKKDEKTEKSQNHAGDVKVGSNDNVPLSAPCPLCGKTFSRGQELVRGNHLRDCGASRGMDTGHLLKIAELERRHADERKALGLPSVISEDKVSAQVSKRKKKSATAATKVRG